MKNIHILPTDKPSRLGYLTKKGKEVFRDLRLFDRFMPNILDSENQHIYITSDEEIKEGDWVYHCASNKLFKYDGRGLCVEVEKIILTTDQDLIADGVQAIDDEFLEWFVKNPSCEFVEVKENLVVTQDKPLIQHQGSRQIVVPHKIDYKIIIPKEEPKQDYSKIKEGLKKSIEGKAHFIQHFKNGGTVEEFKPLESKQETLEDAFEKTWLKSVFTKYSEPKIVGKNLFIEGSSWQAERMYSEEEVNNMFDTLKINSVNNVATITNVDLFINSWKKQFKKK